ncbi:hypothetical protein [Metabacillus litoralis]|uniref:hypothetical protein n=1 Tax=Metabacillus litoralis TaxID=152268 RepID=UPI001CFDE042|nr:hypothetical protein [Metabacillus litoralis]
MKYYLYDLHVALNMDNISEKENDFNDKQLQQNIARYQEIYKTLSDRLPSDVYQHFHSWGFHDYHLTKMELEHKSLVDLSVHFTLSSDVENKDQEKKWLLSFNKVSFYHFQHHNYDNEQSIFHKEIDNWLYQEFLPIDNATLSFEVLFESGANILLHFPSNFVAIKRIK